MLARLRAATRSTPGPEPADIMTSFIPEDIEIKTRLPGQREYVPFAEIHRETIAKAGRIRLLVSHKVSEPSTAGDKGKPSGPFKMDQGGSASKAVITGSTPAKLFTYTTDYVDAIEEHTLPEYLKAFMIAGSSASNSSSDGAQCSGTSATPLTKNERTSATNESRVFWIPGSQHVHSKSPRSVSGFLLDHFITKGEAMALIEQKFSELSVSEKQEKAAPVLPSSSIQNPEESSFGHSAICDHCDCSIDGTRYKCLDCPDFDSCQTCWESVRAGHSSHRFVVAIKDDALIAPLSARKTVVHENVHCDGPLCRTKTASITGDRYKCVICPDYDLCAHCEACPGPAHNVTHPLMKIKSPISSVSIRMDHGSKKVPSQVSPKKSCEQEVSHTSEAPSTVSPGGVAPSSHLQGLRRFFPDVSKRQAVSNKPVLRHPTVVCDGCDRMIRGSRFMCATCKDFDLCEKCYTSVDHTSDHVFVRYNHFVNNVTVPRLHIDAVQAVKTAGSHEGFYCNECGHCPIKGLRFTCLTCNDYDVCEGCSMSHEQNHAMMIIPAISYKDAIDSISFKDASIAPTDDNLPQWQATLSAQQEGLAERTARFRNLLQESVSVARSAAKAAWKSSPVAMAVAENWSPNSEVLPAPFSPLTAEKESDAINKQSDIGISQDDLEALSSEFVEDISIPDGSAVTSNASFVKQWLLKNNGDVAWPAGTTIAYTSGVDCSSIKDIAHARQLSTQLAAVQPGQSVVVSIPLQAPASAQQNVVSYFKLMAPDGHRFGCALWIDIDVVPMRSDSIEPSSAVNTVPESSSKSDEAECSELLFESPVATEKSESKAEPVSVASESMMIFPSASTLIAADPESSYDSHSNAETQQGDEGWDSAEEVTLSDDEDYDILDEESYSD